MPTRSGALLNWFLSKLRPTSEIGIFSSSVTEIRFEVSSDEKTMLKLAIIPTITIPNIAAVLISGLIYLS